MSSFNSVIESFENAPQSLEWTTNTGFKIQGVLYKSDDAVFLNVNVEEHKEVIKFEYIYRISKFGSKRILYPFPSNSSKCIPVDPIRESWPIQIYMIIDESTANIPDIKNLLTFTFKSFLWGSVPKDKNETSEYEKIHEKMSNIDTPIGKVSFSTGIGESISSSPAETKKYMDQISVTIECEQMMNNKDILMWHARFSQYLAFLRKERVVPLSISKALDNIYVPSLVEDYEDQSYAWREPISLDEFSEYVNETVANFITKYDEFADILDDMTLYYRDYPMRPPDNIQLIRLFTAIEQVSNHARKKEKTLKEELSDDQQKRKKEFTALLKAIKDSPDITDAVNAFLKDKCQKFYVTEGSKNAPKQKIYRLAKLLQDSYGMYTPFTAMNNVELVLDMRNTVAHGRGKKGTRNEFYKKRNDLGQGIEELIRIHTLRAFGASDKVINQQKSPLKSIQFNIS